MCPLQLVAHRELLLGNARDHGEVKAVKERGRWGFHWHGYPKIDLHTRHWIQARENFERRADSLQFRRIGGKPDARSASIQTTARRLRSLPSLTAFSSKTTNCFCFSYDFLDRIGASCQQSTRISLYIARASSNGEYAAVPQAKLSLTEDR